MAEHGGTGGQRRQLRAAGERLITTMLADEKLVELLVEGEINRRITEGQLIPADRLVLGGAAVISTEELTFLRERTYVLEDAVHRAQITLENGDPRAALHILDEVRPPEYEDEEAPAADTEADTAEDETDAGTDEQAGQSAAPEGQEDGQDEGPEAPAEPAAAAPAAPADGRKRVMVRTAPAAAPGQVQQRNQTGGGDGPVALEPSGRPYAMPDPTKTHSCNRCSKDVDGLQAEMSYIRTREILCREDLIAWKEPVGGPIDDPDEPEAEAS